MREDSQAEIQTRIKNDVIPNRAESLVRNLLFAADEPNDRARRNPPAKTATSVYAAATAKDSRFLTAEAVRNDKGFGMREDSRAEIQARIKNDVIPNRAASPVRNLLFPADEPE
jgi:hypothetical protein